MVFLELSPDKYLDKRSATQLFKTENNFERIKIKFPLTVSGRYISDYKIQLAVVNEENKYFSYDIELVVSGDGYESVIDVAQDLTDEVQTICVYLKLISGDTIGLTNRVELQIEDTPEGDEEITPRSALETLVESLNTRVTQQNTIITQLNGVVTQKSAEIAALESEKEGLITIKTSLEQQIQDAQDNISSLESQLADTNATIAQYERTIENKQSEIDGLLAEINEIQAFVENLNTQIENALAGGDD